MSTLEKTFFAINNFVEGLKSNRKLIADDSALFFVVKDIDSSQIKLDVHQTKNKCVSMENELQPRYSKASSRNCF